MGRWWPCAPLWYQVSQLPACSPAEVDKGLVCCRPRSRKVACCQSGELPSTGP